MSRPPLGNGAPWLKVGDRVEVKTDAGWLLCRVDRPADTRPKYLGYANIEVPGSRLGGCVCPWNYGTAWRLPPADGQEMAVGL